MRALVPDERALLASMVPPCGRGDREITPAEWVTMAALVERGCVRKFFHEGYGMNAWEITAAGRLALSADAYARAVLVPS